MNSLAACFAEVNPAALELVDLIDAHLDQEAEDAAIEAEYERACQVGYGNW